MEIRFQHVEPGDIERRSMEIIRQELRERPYVPDPENEPVLLRCIHTSADFDYAENLKFSPEAVSRMRAALRDGARIITDTEMARAGISKPSLRTLGCEARCFMSDPEVASEARARGVTRAAVSMEHAAKLTDRPLLFTIGNAPTALIELHRLIHEEGLRPAGIIAVPVGFVNVVEAKELILRLSGEAPPYCDIPWIAARGRKGGSNIAACIVNALLYGMPEIRRG